jgi:hypothetical protein
MTKGTAVVPLRAAAEQAPFLLPKVMKGAVCPATTFYEILALPFVIPSEAEGSAVQRTRPGDVFD